MTEDLVAKLHIANERIEQICEEEVGHDAKV